MAEQTVTVTDGNNTWTVSISEHEAMVKNRTAAQPKLTVVSEGRIDAIYENADGDEVRELLDPEQAARRAKMGQDVAATPERIEAHRKKEQERFLDATADEHNFTTAVNAALPGAQYLQNLAVGKDAATEARQRLNANNPLMNVAGNIAEFAIGGKALSMGFKGLAGAERAAKLGTKIGFGPGASGLSRAGRLAVGEAAIETHFYTQSLLDNDSEFVAEDWARQVGVGMLIGAPFIAGAGLRGVGQGLRRAADAAGAHLPGAMSTVGDAMTVGAVLSPLGRQAQKYARGAAGFHVAGRVYRKLFNRGKGRSLGVADEVMEAQAKHLDDMDHVGGLTPERLDKMSASKRRAYLEDFRPLADGNVDFLDEIAWGSLGKRTRNLQSKVGSLRTQLLGVHRRLQGDGAAIRMSNVARNRALTEANILLGHVDAAGMADVRGSIQRAIISGGAEPQIMHRALMEARINARFRRGVDAGADIVDDRIRTFLDDPKLWGARQAAKNAKINAAVDDVVKVWDDLGDLHIPKHLEDVSLNDGLFLRGSQGAVARLRSSIDTLEREGLLSRQQVRNIETRLIEADTAITDGTSAYGDVLKVNAARRAASAKLDKEAALGNVAVPTSPESFAAQKMAMVGETASDIMGLMSKSLDMVLDTRSQVALSRGVLGLHATSEADKRQIFTAIQKELPTLTGNPQYATDQISKLVDRGAAYDPAGTDQAAAKMVNTMYWLASQMPKPDDTIYGRLLPHPLSEVEEYLEKHVAAYDPISVGYAAILGRATPAMVDAVRVTAPAMYAQMNAGFAEVLAGVDALKADPNVVAGIGLFMGGLDPMNTGEFIMQLQSTFAQTSTQDGVIRGGVNNMPNPSNPQDPRSGFTQAQRQAR